MTISQHGGSRPRAGRKPRNDPDHPTRTQILAIKVDPDIKAFYDNLPLCERKRLIEEMQTILRRAHIQSLII